MDTKSRRPKDREGLISALNAAIEVMDLAKGLSTVPPVKDVFGTVSITLTTLRDTMIDDVDYVELGLACAEVCTALDRALNGRLLKDLNNSVCKATTQLTTTVLEIQRKIIKQGKRNVVSRLIHSKDDKKMIATWRLDLDRILRVFNTEPATNTHVVVSNIHRNTLKSRAGTSSQNSTTHASAPGKLPPPLPRNTNGTGSGTRYDAVKVYDIVSEAHRDVLNTFNVVSDIHRNMLKGQEGTDGQHRSTQISVPGEFPPPPPRTFFGRDELIERIVDLAENLLPIVLIGAGGIGKTSVALAVLRHDQIKKRFGDERRFIRCDQFPVSQAHFLRRLSTATGAGIENPEDLTPLRSFLSSKEMLIVLDNAESILDPQGTDALEIYAVVEKLDYKHLDIPTLSMDAARRTFYRIYGIDDQPDLINDILEQLDFHPLSVTLLAAVAHQNKWDNDRLATEWKRHQTGMLQTEHGKGLAATIELSLASPMFQELGPDARALLGVVAFFPQGVDENNLDWLFPTILNRAYVFDKFCILSLAYQSNGFITMLAPLRDYLSPNDPKSSPLLHMTKERYFTRMLVNIDPNEPGFGDTRWIILEDVNVEHLLDIFTSIDANSDSVWDACVSFTNHLYWHKKRLVVLGPRIEGLPDDNRSKPKCLFGLSRLFDSVGNQMECKRVLSHALKLLRERGDDLSAAVVLRELSDTNRQMGLYEEGIETVKEALENFERFGPAAGQARCLGNLACLLWECKQLDAAEEAGSRAINLFSEQGDQFQVCQCHRVLGDIYYSKGELEKAVHHFEAALGIASSFNWHFQLFWVRYALARLSFNQRKFDDADAHIERAKLHAVDNAYFLGHVMVLQASFWYRRHQFEEAKSEVLRAAELYEKLGAANDLERCREHLQRIEQEMKNPATLYLDGLGWHRFASLFGYDIRPRRGLRQIMAKCRLRGFWVDIIMPVTPFTAAFGVAVIAALLLRTAPPRAS